jgi:hypothetical protein
MTCHRWVDGKWRPEASQRVQNAVDAIEAFVAAKIRYEKQTDSGAMRAARIDVDETREHLRDKLAEVLS